MESLIASGAAGTSWREKTLEGRERLRVASGNGQERESVRNKQGIQLKGSLADGFNLHRRETGLRSSLQCFYVIALPLSILERHLGQAFLQERHKKCPFKGQFSNICFSCWFRSCRSALPTGLLCQQVHRKCTSLHLEICLKMLHCELWPFLGLFYGMETLRLCLWGRAMCYQLLENTS